MHMSRRSVIAGAAGIAAAQFGANSSSARPVPFSMDRLIEDAKQAVAAGGGQPAIEEVLGRAISNHDEVLTALGEPTDVGLQEIYRADDLTILNVVWSPYMVQLPHDHKMWATIGIYSGREDNIIWHRRGIHAEAATASSVGAGEVFSLPEHGVHSVTNPLPRLTCAIHIYGGDFFAAEKSEWDPETLRERPMDFEAAQERFRDANDRFRGRE